LKLSARNSLNGNIEEIIIGSVNAEVVVNGNSICKGFKRYHQKGWFKSLYIKFLEWQLRMLSE
jgi:hypothetical protein